MLVYFFDHRVGVGRVFLRGLLSWDIRRESGTSESNVWLDKFGPFNGSETGEHSGGPQDPVELVVLFVCPSIFSE